MKRILAASIALLLMLVCLSGCDRNDDTNPSAGTAAGEGTDVTGAVPDTSAESGAGTEASESPSEVPTEAPTEVPTEAPTEPASEAPTEAETEPEAATDGEKGARDDSPAVDPDAPTLGDVLDTLQLDKGMLVTSEGKLTLGVSVFGMVIHTDLPMTGALAVGDTGAMLTGEVPFAGTMELRFVDNLLYLNTGERKLVFDPAASGEETETDAQSEPETEPGGAAEDAPGGADVDVPGGAAEDVPGGKADESEQTDPAEGIDLSALPELWAGIRSRLDEALWLLPVTLPDEGGMTYTVNLSEWASEMADSLGAEYEPDENTLLLLSWMQLLAADESAVLTVTADPSAPDAPLAVSLDCPVPTELLMKLLSLLSGLSDITGESGADMSGILSQAVSEARFTLKLTLSGGPQEILPPADAEAYVPYGESSDNM